MLIDFRLWLCGWRLVTWRLSNRPRLLIVPHAPGAFATIALCRRRDREHLSQSSREAKASDNALREREEDWEIHRRSQPNVYNLLLGRLALVLAKPRPAALVLGHPTNLDRRSAMRSQALLLWLAKANELLRPLQLQRRCIHSKLIAPAAQGFKRPASPVGKPQILNGGPARGHD